MNILMDLLAIQSEGSRGRGIGRYSEELSKNILKLHSADVTLLLNSLFPEHKEDILNTFSSLIDEKNIQEYRLLDSSDKDFKNKSLFNNINSFLIEKQFSKYNNADIIHFHSIFEGLEGKADTLKTFLNITNLKTVITLYDLIPLIFKDTYLVNEDVRKWYFNKLRLIYEADLLFAISDATREDAINILGIPEEKVINISGAIDSSNFFKLKTKNDNEKTLIKYGINQPYLMYTGGIDFRKNLEVSIEAFSKIKQKNFENFQYVIVCKINDDQRKSFQELIKKLDIPDNKVIFTGFVSDEELNYLYNKAYLFIFPSIYEGFGLPVLEAMSCGTPVIGSNASSIPEIIGRDDCMFDPTSIEDISNKIDYVLDDKNLVETLKDYFYDRSKLFSWEKSAQIAIAGYKKLEKKEKVPIKNTKVAFFTPLPPKRSGISDYCLELIPFLSKYMNIDIYVDDYDVKDDYIKYNFNIFSYKEFESKKNEYENIIYQFGNSEFHQYMYNIALNNPGIIVLHDFFLSGLVNYIADKTQNPSFFFNELVYSHGKIGEEYSNKILSNEIEVVNAIIDLPMNKSIVNSAKAIIVHSNYSKDLFKKYYKDEVYNIFKIEQLIKAPSKKIVDSKSLYRKKLKFDDDDVVLSAFGHITDTKQYDFILESIIKENILKNKNIKLCFVGDFICEEYKKKIFSLIESNNIDEQVFITGFVNDSLYREYLLASDIGINLRINSRGETSRALLMNMAYGLPTIINDYASFSEITDTATHKVKMNDGQSFTDAISLLVKDKEYRNRLSINAFKHIQKYHNPDAIAFEIYNILLDQIASIQDKKEVIPNLAKIIVDNNLDLNESEYVNLAEVIKKCK
ncbi:glycosyltransferase [Halarcobacter sp.]|uniref:glycosyltransferase n=1 Tax=Halarcobacter sp. TaxID=2321133 RepID=UPI002AA72BEF|nr:glycosyltransferase [Halarcobacter sp.]